MMDEEGFGEMHSLLDVLLEDMIGLKWRIDQLCGYN